MGNHEQVHGHDSNSRRGVIMGQPFDICLQRDVAAKNISQGRCSARTE